MVFFERLFVPLLREVLPKIGFRVILHVELPPRYLAFSILRYEQSEKEVRNKTTAYVIFNVLAYKIVNDYIRDLTRGFVTFKL
jgi:hypothetical protein